MAYCLEESTTLEDSSVCITILITDPINNPKVVGIDMKMLLTQSAGRGFH